jgi:protein-disulfide isomerase
MLMKTLYLFFIAAVLASASSFAQKPDDVIATATGHTFYYRDLQPDTQKGIDDLPAQIKEVRKQAFEEMIDRRLLDLEAKATNTPGRSLVAAERAKVAAPTEAEIKAVYTSNQARLGGQPLEAVREQIIEFLRAQGEQKALIAMFDRFRTKYKYTAGKDINAVGLGSTDVVATINGRSITAKEFDDFAKVELYDVKADLGDQIVSDIDSTIFNALAADEAKALGIPADEFLAREITSKMKDYSDEEREMLNDALQRRLFAKYKVKLLYKEPAPLVQDISVDDDPATGPADAPVTIVVFSDFQCPACSAYHPVLKTVMAEFPGKIRFVVRDYPLESRHEHAFRAALAANAAKAQGKFFEYGDILYTHQDALDDDSLRKYAAQLGLNLKQFDIDFNSEKTAAEVRHDIDDGDSYGVMGTPTIFVNGVSVRKYSALGFREAIERALNNSQK